MEKLTDILDIKHSIKVNECIAMLAYIDKDGLHYITDIPEGNSMHMIVPFNCISNSLYDIIMPAISLINYLQD